jgi:hypothetical protein
MNHPTVPANATDQPSVADAEPANAFRYVVSPGFADLLDQLESTLLLTTYQAGKLMTVRARAGRVSTLLRTFERPMGLARKDDTLALGTRNAVWFLRNARDIAAQLAPANTHDACFTPRQSHVTGDILGHEMSWRYSPPAIGGESCAGESGQRAVGGEHALFVLVHSASRLQLFPPLAARLSSPPLPQKIVVTSTAWQWSTASRRYVTALGQQQHA